VVGRLVTRCISHMTPHAPIAAITVVTHPPAGSCQNRKADQTQIAIYGARLFILVASA
jgi:hypothetical protein